MRFPQIFYAPAIMQQGSNGDNIPEAGRRYQKRSVFAEVLQEIQSLGLRRGLLGIAESVKEGQEGDSGFFKPRSRGCNHDLGSECGGRLP